MQRIKNREKELRLGNFENNDEEILDLAQHIYILLTILKKHVVDTVVRRENCGIFGSAQDAS